jgi:hypothetical protein
MPTSSCSTDSSETKHEDLGRECYRHACEDRDTFGGFMAHASIGPAQQLEESVSIELPGLAYGRSIDKLEQLMLFDHDVAAVALDTLGLHNLTKFDQIA